MVTSPGYWREKLTVNRPIEDPLPPFYKYNLRFGVRSSSAGDDFCGHYVESRTGEQ
jgi:hypothetical protein